MVKGRLPKGDLGAEMGVAASALRPATLAQGGRERIVEPESRALLYIRSMNAPTSVWTKSAKSICRAIFQLSVLPQGLELSLSKS